MDYGLTIHSVCFEFVQERLAFTGEGSPMVNRIRFIRGAFAEFERALICERHREGIALVKQRRTCRSRHESVDR
jgi:DNA invertase Pin-like site-specific DNA recombinase